MKKPKKKMIISLKPSYQRIRKKRPPPSKVIPDKKKEANKNFCRKRDNDE